MRNIAACYPAKSPSLQQMNLILALFASLAVKSLIAKCAKNTAKIAKGAVHKSACCDSPKSPLLFRIETYA